MSEQQRDDNKISKKIDNEVKRFESIEKCFAKILESEKLLREKRLAAFDLFKNLETEENNMLRDIYNTFKNNMVNLEKTRDNKLIKLEKTIIPAARYYPQKVKEFKRPINKIKDLVKSQNSYKEKSSKAKEKQQQDEVNHFERELQDAKTKHEKEGNDLERDMLYFEAERVGDNKALILHYIHSELAYHANALQSMSKLYQEINIIEPKEDLKKFINEYNLNSMKDFNLEDKFDFKQGVTKEKKEEIEKRTTRLNQGTIEEENSKISYLIFYFILIILNEEPKTLTNFFKDDKKSGRETAKDKIFKEEIEDF